MKTTDVVRVGSFLPAILWLLNFAASPLFAATNYSSAPVLHLAIATHSEDWHSAGTPNYSSSKINYVNSRNALITFARIMQDRGLTWNWECDWNFLNAAYTNEVLNPDTNLLAATSGSNLVSWLRNVMNVETDPHSHENDGYNYADVAYLFTRMGVNPSSVVGGHVYDPAYGTAYQNWPRFTNGLRGAIYTNYVWRPQLLMGAGTPAHVADGVASGIWHPAATNDYFADSTNGLILSWGMWDQDRLPELFDRLATNGLPTNRMWTAGFTVGQQNMISNSFLTNVVLPMMDSIAALRDAGRIRVMQFEEGLGLWTNSFANAPSNFLAPLDCVTFSLNMQDFSYPHLSSNVLDRALTLHESLGVPVDVFLTTTMVDMYESNCPALFNRLLTSPVAALAYHTRPPVPYRVNYDWTTPGLTSLSSNAVFTVVTNYETHGLDLITGQPTAAPGGYKKLRDLAGYSPFIVGVATENPIQGPVQTAFSSLGARISVAHGSIANLTNKARFGMFTKPEQIDLRLFETNHDGLASAVILSNAFAAARLSNGAAPPYFVGVKMHDNDFFASNSAWVTVYQDGPHVPPWSNAYTLKSGLISAAEQTNMWQRYEDMVHYVAANPDRYTPVNARGILKRLGLGPQWAHLSPAAIAEAAAVGTSEGNLSLVTNRTFTPTNSTWALVSGVGSDNNANFTVNGPALLSAAMLDHESQPFAFVRLRGKDTDSLWVEQFFAIAVTNITSDDDDGDGYTEAQELVAGTDALDANSALQFSSAVPASGNVQLSWSAVVGRTYALQFATNVAGPYLDISGTQTNAAATNLTLLLDVTTAPLGFYRLRVTSP